MFLRGMKEPIRGSCPSRRTSMPALSTSHTRRDLLAVGAAAGALSLMPAHLAAAVDGSAIRPFRVNFPEQALVDLRRRINATVWPDRETVADASQGVQLATIPVSYTHLTLP